MSKSYVIQWKSKVNGRAGQGTKHFPREEAERLAAELNREYPDIEHRAVPQETALAPPLQPQNQALERPTEEPAGGASEPAPSFSGR